MRRFLEGLIAAIAVFCTAWVGSNVTQALAAGIAQQGGSSDAGSSGGNGSGGNGSAFDAGDSSGTGSFDAGSSDPADAGSSPELGFRTTSRGATVVE